MLRDAGCYVVVGQYTDSGDATLNPHRHLNRKHVDGAGVLGLRVHAPPPLGSSSWPATTRASSGRELITREYALQDAGQALQDMERLAVVKALIRPYGNQ